MKILHNQATVHGGTFSTSEICIVIIAKDSSIHLSAIHLYVCFLQPLLSTSQHVCLENTSCFLWNLDVMLLALLLNDKRMHLNIFRLMVNLVSILNSLFFYHEMSPFGFCSKCLGGMVLICFSLICLWTNNDSVKKEMHKWYSVESASVSANQWQNMSFRSKSLETDLIAAL